MNIPNMITILRILLIPVYLYFFYSSLRENILLAGIIFIIAGISDVLDGYIARKYNLTSKLGIVLDPIADKLMTFTILISFTTKGIIPPWILIAIGIKEIAMILGGAILYLFKGKQVMPSNKYGKVATLSFYAATLSVVFKFPELLSKTLFFLTVVLNVIAFINYFIIYIKMRHNTLNDIVDK
ncbi:CDP-diacylglycerol--glycerol-3-phosphate 3-phosphatidyltransferase [Tissierella pigra]|uniref:CDP-diacylglycerol--glycerol-3-phosphate 3-phosphatidyltransferase n=1 Tax=Tissierella pigra TaxID=2607614 RepID=A0A6N7XYP0_9FIRM|nr:CDP-diacylglycerol--glycerol-3-phosphate 3-phosphatidyltransferase [Tissierella pigra]MBU5427339.1 CDP-diacylglycerol--glycerol-3-phosphate 3-phosphatidyltransferase [Tissierella pigra]MSU01368.1 CDP-diacylglycerol--glycerol-3-phosphate 3-phosphatidyltransferase [Tissierella pigra]